MARRKKRQPKRLPPYIVEKGDDWHVKIYVATKERYASGQKKYLEFTRKCEPKTEERAAAVAAFLKREVAKAKIGPETVPTVGAVLDRFLSAKTPAVAPATAYSYEFLVDVLKRYSFVKLQLESVTPMTIQNLYGSMGESPKLVRRVHSFLVMVFKQAILWELMGKNPCDGVIVPKPPVEETKAMSPEEAKRFAAACGQDDLMFLLALETGLRPQEVLALTWGSVNLDRCTLDVRSATSETNGVIVLKEPKTYTSRRTLHFSSRMQAMIREHRAAQIQRKVSLTVRRNQARYDLVFPSICGKPRSRNNLNNREFKDALDRAELAGFSFKCLRHTFGSIMAEKVSAKKLQRLMGHRDVKTTLKYYVHVGEGHGPEMENVLY